MAYADIGDVASGDPVTETYLDQIRANFLASAPDAFTTLGDIFAATGADAGARLAVGANDSTLVPDSGETTGLAWQIQPATRVYNSADIDPATSTWVSATFDSERYDTDAMHSTSTNTDRLTVPSGGAGLYSIGACMEFATGISANASSYVGVRFLLNGTTVIAEDFRVSYRAGSHNLIITLSTEYSLAATDYVAVQVYTSQDVNVVATGNHSPEFWARWERRA